eukprot:jgi/Ulvmu1/10167/UM006_0122.1
MTTNGMSIPCCPVSEEPYDLEGPNRPRILPCGHTISHAALAQILKLPNGNSRRACPIDRQPLLLRTAEDYPVNFTMIEIIRNLKSAAAASPPAAAVAAAPVPPPRTPSPSRPFGSVPPEPEDTYAQDHLLAEYLQASWNGKLPSGAGPDAVDLPGHSWDAANASFDITFDATAPAAAAARAHPDRPPQPPLQFADVIPPGGRMSAAAWELLEGHYKLPPAAVVGGPHDWGPLGLDADGNRTYRGNLHAHGRLTPVALCCAAVLPAANLYFQRNLSVGSFAAAAGDDCGVRAAVAPHAALQLLPDVRPHLPRLHGFFTRPDSAAAGSERLWLAYDVAEGSLAEHLDSQPTTSMPTQQVVRVLHQLASALEAMHRRHFATPVLHPLTLASVQLAAPGTPTPSALLVPYALSRPAAAPAPSPIISMLEALCVPPEATEVAAIMDESKGDIWRVAAVAVAAIAGDVLFECMDDAAAGAAASLLEAAVTRLESRSDDHSISPKLAVILRSCLRRDPRQRWTAEKLQDALLSEAIDMLDIT